MVAGVGTLEDLLLDPEGHAAAGRGDCPEVRCR